MIVKAQLLYGLHLIALTKAQKQRINAFQFKGLRKILNLKTTYIDRTLSNDRVFAIANETIIRDTKQATRAKTHFEHNKH